MFIGKYNRSLIVTYIGVIFIVIGIKYALLQDIKISILCLAIAGVCDMFDGKIARLCKRDESEKLFGIEIDSLADTVSFVAFPVILGYSMGLNNWYHVLGYCLFILAGITRLGFFNISVMDKNKDTPVKYYSGLPVTSVAFILPLFWFLSNFIKVMSFKYIYIYLIYIVSFLFIYNFKLKKPSGNMLIIIGVLAAIGIIILMLV